MKHLNKILLSSALAVFILLAQPVRAEVNPLLETLAGKYAIEIKADADL